MTARAARVAAYVTIALAVLGLGACDGGGATHSMEPDDAGLDAWREPVVSPLGFAATDGVPPTIAPDPARIAVADPKLDGAGAWRITFLATRGGTGDARCEVALLRGDTVVATPPAAFEGAHCVAHFSGRDAAGSWLAPGPLRARGTVYFRGDHASVRAEEDLFVVRVGVASVDVTENPVEPGSCIALLYAKTDGVRGAYEEHGCDALEWKMAPDVAEAPRGTILDLADGTPRPPPSRWTSVTSPPLDMRSPDELEHDAYSLPSAWRVGASPTLRVLMALQRGGVADVDVRVVAPDGFAVDDAARTITDEGVIAFAATQPVAPKVGRYDVDVRFRFEARVRGGTWTPVAGASPVALRFYGVVGQPTLGATTLPYRAWVEVVDQVASWVAGTTDDSHAVAARIVDGVYRELGLQYDRRAGASFYTEYGTTFGSASYALGAFLDRENGSTINCSDAASIVSTFANMVGIDFRYHILRNVRRTSGFDLNFIQSIGWPGFTETPFTGGRGSFSYHAVTGPADGTFFDATLALDGDGIPTELPATELLATGMSAADYLFDLTSIPDRVDTTYDEKVRLP